MENYPSKQLSMRTIFQRGNINESQILELNQNALKTIGKTEKNTYLPMQTPNPYDYKGISSNYLMTPNTKKLFAFGESSANDL
jgi:hypothetical protein